MSILYGNIDFRGGDAKIEGEELLEGCLSYSYDVHKALSPTSNVYLGCLNRGYENGSGGQVSPFKYKNWVISSYSRLDNRSFLFKELQISQQNDFVSDCLLIALAYEKWGVDIVYKIKGDWIISIWDIEKNQLFVAKDFHGPTGVYYTLLDNHFYYCSSLKGILNLTNRANKINYNFIANYITQATIELGETSFNGVSFLPPCHYLIVNDSESDLVKYWSIEDIKEVSFSNSNDYYESFLDIYTECVSNRLRYKGNIGSTLSGGLDSGSVSLLAAKLLDNKDQALYAFSSVSEFVKNDNSLNLNNKFVDEREYAELTAECADNISWYPIFGNKINVIDGIRRATYIDSAPVYAPSNAHWLYEIFNTASKNNVKVLLNGQEGNNTVSWSGNDSVKSTIAKTLKTLIYDLYPSIEGVKTSRVLKKSAKGVLQEKFIVDNNIFDKIDETVNEWTNLRKISSIEKRAYLMSLTTSNSGVLWQNSALYHNIETPDPTADERIIKFCLGIPDKLYHSKDYDRYLLRKTFKNKLPEKVLFSRKLGLQGIDNWIRLKRDSKDIIAFLDNSGDVFNSIYKKETLKRSLDFIINDPTGRAYLEYGPQLLEALGIGVFLEEFTQ